ncbi:MULTISPECIES: TRAP transporter small permease [Thalassospira]|uniref:TRAP transporter small permease protein n=1 Tax=Thalassospira xiamenensis TaxID=220697 RepID=A0A285RV32_9PROT|nr:MULTISPECIES: TRAP transporter small permease [Thalassospira]MCH2275324.1 TRAP transporter small permease [Thalassospira sp.]MCK2166838.1 TRAP transporter small permease [Thalassospira xiamenensis]WOI09098.1 TRAP transporter small permease [Thalassospira lucentensis]SOB96232.1 TRAP-type C4-dicarboxylate transport system, small permease component [Thalassospira xiamenensis]
MSDSNGEAPAPKGGVLSVLKRLDDGLSVVERQLLGWSIVIMAVNTVANVIMRLGFSSSIFFSEELNQFLIILVTFVGISEAARMGRHIRMSAFTDMLGPQASKIMMIIITLGTAALLFLLAWYSIGYVSSLIQSNRLTPALRIPYYLTVLIVPFGLTVTGIQFVLAAVTNIVRPGTHLSYRVEDTFSEADDHHL